MPAVRRVLMPLAAATALAGAAALAPAAAGAAPAAAASAVGTTVLSRQAMPQVAGAHDLGSVAASMPVHLDVALDNDVAAQEAAVAAIEKPGSPTYHHYFTPASWAARFSVPKATYDATLTRLTAFGLTVAYASPMRNIVNLSGTAAQAEATFGVALHNFRVGNGPTFYANVDAPTVPASVTGVAGLTNMGTAGARGARQQDGCAPAGGVCVGGLREGELRSIYDVSNTYAGGGQKFAEIGDGDVLGVVADLRAFEKEYKLPQVPTKWISVGDKDCATATGVETSSCDTGGEGEWAMDVESGTAMAPDLSELDFYFADSEFYDNGSIYTAWASDPNGPLQGSDSEGICELYEADGPSPVFDGTMATFTPGLTQLQGEGRTLFVSSGDEGGSCNYTLVGQNGVTNDGAPAVEWPASSPSVTSVGGTVIYSNGSGQRATVGPEQGEVSWTHGGGGSSLIWAEPSWQQGISAIDEPCVLNEDLSPNTSGATCRGVPDVAALSGDISLLAPDETGGAVPGQGFWDVEGGTPTGCNASGTAASGGTYPCAGADGEDGGTSLSSPLWAGMWASIQSSAPSTAGYGFASPLLYAIGENATEDASDFYDVTAGSNVQNAAEPRSALDPSGWDYTTGLGAPDVTHIIATLTAAGTGTDLPEAPSPALLLVLPALMGAAILVVRRRRAAGTE